MSAGTLTLTNNSAAVSGSGTAFITELAAGDFIVATVGGIPYTLPVKTVNSNTSLTLVSNFTGPTQAGAAWSAVPRIAMNLVTAAVVTQAAEALRGLNYDKQNWQSIFSGTGNVTVKLPDNTTWTGPAWGNVAKKGDNSDITSLSGLTTALSVKQGGTGSADDAGARTNIGLGGKDDVTFQSVTTNSGNITCSGGAMIIDKTRYTNFIFRPNDEKGNIPDEAALSRFMIEAAYTTTGGVGVSFIRRRFNGSSTNQAVISLPNTAGVISVQGTSGRDYKDSVVPADSAEAMDRIMGLALVNFIYKDDEQKRQRFGIIAEDAEQIAPQYIKHNQFPVEGSEVFDDEGNKVREEYRDRPSIDVNPIVMDLLGAIQYQQKMIRDMAESIKTLESRLT